MLKILIPITSLLIIQSWNHSIHSLIIISLIIMTYMSPMMIPTSLSELLTLDSMSISLLILTTWISMLMIIASYSIKTSKKHPSMFLSTCLILMLFLMLSFSVNNLLMFYTMFEASLIPTLFMILIWGYQPERLQAGTYMMMYTITASLPLLMGILSMANQFNSLNMFSIHHLYHISNPHIWWLILMTAFMVKMPMFGLHLWLPKAHVEAPVAGSMVLAGILLKLGSYGLLRMSYILSPINASMTNFIVAICMIGGVMTGLTCIRQPDLKALIAYSSVAHMALLTAGVMSNFLWGWEGALAMMLAHGLCSSALFAIANSTYETTQTRSLFLTKGLLSLFPSMTLWWFILLAANLGAPPSLNLISEIMLLTSILSISTPLGFLIALTSFMAATYSLILFTSTQHGPSPSFLNPLMPYPHQTHLLMMLHSVPLFLLIMKTSLICLWL